jgi:hypothetical protein
MTSISIGQNTFRITPDPRQIGGTFDDIDVTKLTADDIFVDDIQPNENTSVSINPPVGGTTRPVRVSTTGPLNLANDFEPGDVIDGIVLQEGDRILIKNQAASIENGIYDVQSSGTPVRSSDYAAGQSVSGLLTIIQEGVLNVGTGYTNTAPPGSDVIGTDAMPYVQTTLGGGPLSVTQGGTGVVALTAGQVLVGDGVNPVDITKAAPTGDFVGTTDAQTLSNKNLVNNVFIIDNVDPTIRIAFDAAGAAGTTTTIRGTQAANIVLSLPNITDTIVSRTSAEVLSNKTISGAANTINNLSAGNITTGTLGVANGGTGVASLTSGRVVVGNGVGAVNLTKTAPAGDFVGTSDAQALSNKTISGATNTVNNLDASSISTGIFAVARGGTGVGTLTAGRVLVGNGAGTVDLTKTAPTGNFVGTSDVQVLTNKTLTGPSISSPNFTGTIIFNSSNFTDTTNGGTSVIGIGTNSGSGGTQSVGVGEGALDNNAAGGNVAVGYGAGDSVTSTSLNTLIGWAAGTNLTTGSFGTTCVGYSAGQSATAGSGQNTFLGGNSGILLQTGGGNVLVGNNAGNGLTTNATNNVCMGFSSGLGIGANAGGNVIIGSNATVSAGVGALNRTVIGNGAQATFSDNMVRLGDGAIGRFECQVALTVTSDRRLKTNIESLDDMLTYVDSINPVKFLRNSDVTNHITKKTYGFIAQEIEDIMPNDFGSVTHNLTDDTYHLRYEDFHAVAIRSIQQLHDKLKLLDAKVTQQSQEIDRLSSLLQN